MVNGLTRLTGEARNVLKELRLDISYKIRKNITIKELGSFLIIEANKNKHIVNRFVEKIKKK